MEQRKLHKYLTVSLVGLTAVSVQAAEKPNIILIMADDMGYSDIGCYGGEISTPNIDNLAENGIRYRNFYNGARSCPTRASLLTGLYPHQAGIGWMTVAYEGDGSYQGDLSKNALTIAEYLKGEYNTYMTGKWHVSNYRKTGRNIDDNWPVQRGFDRYFGILGGASNYFTPVLCSNNTKYNAPQNFYFTDAVSDTAVVYIRENQDKPFFLYVAYTAPHRPLHARPEDIAKYNGIYDQGWDVVRANRFEKQKQIGLIDESSVLSPRDPEVNAWNAVSAATKEDNIKRMQIYAAQIEVMDAGIGKIIAELERTGQLDNTIIMFLSDNGATSETESSGEVKQPTGAANTYESINRPWANVSNTPYREYKHYAHEGGIITPFIVHWPQGITSEKGSFVDTPGHLIDVFKTIEDITGIAYPETYKGKTIIPLQGESMLPLFKGNEKPRGPMFWEHESNLAVRLDNWKLVCKSPTGTTPVGKLELYDLSQDPTELNDLAESQPQKLNELWDMWLEWAEENDVFPLSTLSYAQRQKDHRYLNGEFNGALYGWNLKTSGTGQASLLLDRTGQMSGTYSAKVTISQTGERPNNAVLNWVLPMVKNERCKIRFKAKANKDVEMIFRLEKNGGTYPKVIDETIQLNDQVKIFEFDSEVIPENFDYRIGFYFGSTAPSQVWIDAVELVFINADSALSPTWDFNAIEGATYAVSFDANTSQFLVPVTVSLKRKNNPQEVYFSETVKVRKNKQTFTLDIPNPAIDEQLYVEFQIPAYATKETFISNLNFEAGGNTSIFNPDESLNQYTLFADGNNYRLKPVDPHREYTIELFDATGKLIMLKNNVKGEIQIPQQRTATYILRIKESGKIIYVGKLL